MQSRQKHMLTAEEVATICNIPVETVRAWFDAGEVQGYRIPCVTDPLIQISSLIEQLGRVGAEDQASTEATIRELMELTVEAPQGGRQVGTTTDGDGELDAPASEAMSEDGMPHAATLEELKLPTRLRNVLLKADVTNVRQLQQLSDSQLLDIPGLGAVSLREVRRALEDHFRRGRYSPEQQDPDTGEASSPQTT